MSQSGLFTLVSYKNKEDQAKAAKRHYEANKDKMKSRARQAASIARVRNASFVFDHKANHPCVDCGNSDPVVLEFDHTGTDKLANVSDMVKNGLSLKRIQEEIDKCDVVCANCHRIRTYSRRTTS
jgi:hypothetical protein